MYTYLTYRITYIYRRHCIDSKYTVNTPSTVYIYVYVLVASSGQSARVCSLVMAIYSLWALLSFTVLTLLIPRNFFLGHVSFPFRVNFKLIEFSISRIWYFHVNRIFQSNRFKFQWLHRRGPSLSRGNKIVTNLTNPDNKIARSDRLRAALQVEGNESSRNMMNEYILKVKG